MLEVPEAEDTYRIDDYEVTVESIELVERLKAAGIFFEATRYERVDGADCVGVYSTSSGDGDVVFTPNEVDALREHDDWRLVSIADNVRVEYVG